MEVKGKLRHFCTASVVQSPHENLAITAAHCMFGRKLGNDSTVTFVPGYHDGKAPYGSWLVRADWVDANWKKNDNPNDDVAFLLIGRPGHRVQKHTGGEQVKFNVPLPQDVEVIGYPDSTNLPISCDNVATRAKLGKGWEQMVFDCGDYTDGTSGGPFLTHVSKKTGLGDVIGVIGGYELGGDLANVSYSARFLNNIARLYDQAVKGS
jgi:V8-like Glu-specific endopeptidase